MKLYELQDADGFGHEELFSKLINDLNKRWEEHTIEQAHYYSQLSISYSMLFKPEECKMYAALVPDSASVQDKTTALSSVARMLVYEKKIEEALDHYKRCYTLDPNDYIAIEEAGWCCIELKQLDQAVELFKRAILLEDFEIHWEGLAYAFAHQEKYAEAIPAFKNALALCKQQPESYYYNHLIGQCYANIKDLYHALDYYTRCLNVNPTYAKALNDMAAVYVNEENDMTTAIEYFKKAEAIAEKDGNRNLLQTIYINLSRIYSQKMEFELQQHYQAKLLEVLGFGGLVDFEDDDEDENEDGGVE